MWESLAVGGVGAAIAFVFNQIAIRLGWAREDKAATGKKIERVDELARAEIARVERELGKRVGGLEKQISTLAETVRHLPTADDLERLTDKVAEIHGSTRSIEATVSGHGELLRTIRDHILNREARP